MARLAGSKTIEKDEMSQEINVRKYFGRKPTDDELTMFSELAKEVIQDRTLDGKDINGKKFEPYSEAYAAKKGVSTDSVDLFDDGIMFDAIDGEHDSEENVRISLLDIDDRVAVGFNHHTGDTLPKRSWFGITTSEAKTIANAVKESEIIEEIEPTESLSALEQAINLLGLRQTE